MTTSRKTRWQLPDDCTPAQALAVFEMIDLIRDRLRSRYATTSTTPSATIDCTAALASCPSRSISHAHDARGDQQCVGHGAEQDHAAHMLTQEALAQHECVLRADGDDEPEAERHGLGDDRQGRQNGFDKRHDGPSMPAAIDEDKLPSGRNALDLLIAVVQCLAQCPDWGDHPKALVVRSARRIADLHRRLAG